MRIISGKHKSRILAEPKGHVAHPMGERVRAALFNILHDVEGLTVLDAFGGSGAIAIEAISRGAKSAWIIEKSSRVYETLKQNVELLHMEDQIRFTRANVSSWSDNNEDLIFDLVICDPPYSDLNTNTIEKLTRHLEKGSLLILSHLSSLKAPELDNLYYESTHEYGNASLSFYKKS